MNGAAGEATDPAAAELDAYAAAAVWQPPGSQTQAYHVLGAESQVTLVRGSAGYAAAAGVASGLGAGVAALKAARAAQAQLTAEAAQAAQHDGGGDKARRWRVASQGGRSGVPVRPRVT